MHATPERLAAALSDRYRLDRELGVGGMATVHLAWDLRHDRPVALKVLKPELAAVIGADRFLLEIKTTANLQHPHILPLFDSGQVDGTVFYVMPFVEGESLRDRLLRERQLPVADAVRIATEVAGALDYAHRHGVIHRDIKPENILLHDGRALVADFGIALAASRTDAGSRLTETGMSLGTPHYMSPEQAMGERAIDARADVYALGCVLHEMLAGEPPFTGPTLQAVVARVLSSDPEPVTALRRTVPEHVADAILHALAKLPADRFATAAEFARALTEGGAVTRPGPAASRRGAGAGAAAGAGRGARARRLLWPAACAAVTVAGLWGWMRPRPEPLPSRLAIPRPAEGDFVNLLLRGIALSPDGRSVVFNYDAGGEQRLLRRRLEDEEATAIAGVAGAFSSPMISPDGREIAVVSSRGTQMFRYPVEGGEGRPLPREAPFSSIMAWGGDGSLWLTPNIPGERGIARVRPDGTVEYPLPPALSTMALHQVLPGDRYALAVRSPVGTSFGASYVIDLQEGVAEPLLPVDVVEVRFTAGYLVYVLATGTMEAVRFDLRTRRALGAPVRIATDVSLTGAGTAHFSVATNGTVAYIPEAPRSLVFVDRTGASRLAVRDGRNYHIPRFSPDGRQLLVDFSTDEGRDVWRLELASGAMNRVTFVRDGHDAAWEPDGRHVSFISATGVGGSLSLFRTAVGRGADADSLFSSPTLGYTGLWLPDGSAIVTTGTSLRGDSRGDIAIIRDRGRGPMEPLLATRFNEEAPAVSPDGRWLAYMSDQTGAAEVYVRPLAGDGDEVRVSLDGGREPVWGPGGRELFYRARAGNAERLMVAALTVTPTFAVVGRRELFDVTNIATSTPHANYDISPDGRTFAMVRQNPASRIMVIQNLPALVAELERGGRR